MPASIFMTRGAVLEGADPTVSIHIETADGTDLQQGDNGESSGTEIDFTIYDLSGDTPGTAITTGTLDKTAVIFDTLQTDGYWNNVDVFGYNFRHTITASDLPGGGKTARVEYKITTTSFGEVKWQAFIEISERFDIAQ